MNTDNLPMYEWNEWREINWKKVERQTFKLQTRIYRASQRGDVKLVHKLQRLLTKSFYGRLWATRKVTQDNRGKVTAGVDGKKSLTAKQRLELVLTLKSGRKAKPLRRVWIPKASGEKRSLGIPTIEDRARQCLIKMALEPQWESKFEENVYGFRPARSCHDAIQAIFYAINQKAKYVLDADIAHCFDKIDHQKLLTKLETYPQLQQQIKQWLKSGVKENGSWYPTTEGTPQGSVCSPLLNNIALHGMEIEIKNYAQTLRGGKRDNQKSLNLIKYADDFVILHENLEVIMDCKKLIEKWLKDIGLELKSSKTRISHTLKEYEGNIGFDFLGHNIRQYPVGKGQSAKSSKRKILGFKTIIKPSKGKIKAHIKRLGEVIRKHKSSSQLTLIKELNPIIRGWSKYYATQCSKKTFSYCDYVLYQQLKRWAERRHPKKGKKWVADKYWHSQGNRNWVFATKGYKLCIHADTPIVRHTKVRGNRSIYDGDLVYWSSRLGKHPQMPTHKAKLLKKQKGKCNHCGLYFKDDDLMEIDHIIPKSLGGKKEYKNLQLLHRHCHDDKTTKDGSLNRTYDRGSISEEPDEVKVSRPVLKTSQIGDCLT